MSEMKRSPNGRPIEFRVSNLRVACNIPEALGDRQLSRIAAGAMPQTHRPLPARCESDELIDVPGPKPTV
ncbi:hypothetical protein [Rhodobacter capsulatus]|uniref:hypothetical protein n=1 Tax=Rhodobacter capsulatus TaxID=1061 RepID=UPI00164EF06D|nr:hypothetical protein [Rhodobacter capsulatus]